MSQAAPSSLITPEMTAMVGDWFGLRSAPPICASDIRRWAMATYWPEQPPRLYWDENYAASTRWGGTIAPPDFNPFAWSIEGKALTTPFLKGPDGIELSPLNGGQRDCFGAPMRAGDVVRERRRITDITDRPGRLGLTLHLITEIEWTNENGAFVRQRLSHSVRYVKPGSVTK